MTSASKLHRNAQVVAKPTKCNDPNITRASIAAQKLAATRYSSLRPNTRNEMLPRIITLIPSDRVLSLPTPALSRKSTWPNWSSAVVGFLYPKGILHTWNLSDQMLNNCLTQVTQSPACMWESWHPDISQVKTTPKGPVVVLGGHSCLLDTFVWVVYVYGKAWGLCLKRRLKRHVSRWDWTMGTKYGHRSL